MDNDLVGEMMGFWSEKIDVRRVVTEIVSQIPEQLEMCEVAFALRARIGRTSHCGSAAVSLCLRNLQISKTIRIMLRR